MRRLLVITLLCLAFSSSFAQTPNTVNGWSYKGTIGNQSAITYTRTVNDTAIEGSHAQAFFFSLPPNTSVEWQKDFGKEYNTPPGFRCQFRPNRFGIQADESVFMNVYLVGNEGSLFEIQGGLFGPWEWWYESDIGTATYGTPPARFRGIVLRFYFNPQTVSGSAELFFDDLRMVFYNPLGADSVVTLDRFGDPEPVPVFSASKTINFGDVQVGSLKTDILYIRNKGTAPLKISSVSSSNVAFAMNLEKLTIQAGDSGRVIVTFHPTATGTVNDNVVIISNAPSSPDTIAVSGTGSSTDVTVEENRNLPLRFVLEQNYPNPFNPSTCIVYRVAHNVHVKLTVYDALGKETVILVDGKKGEGTYTATFDGSHLSSGTYFYCLKTDDGFARTRRMLLTH